MSNLELQLLGVYGARGKAIREKLLEYAGKLEIKSPNLVVIAVSEPGDSKRYFELLTEARPETFEGAMSDAYKAYTSLEPGVSYLPKIMRPEPCPPVIMIDFSHGKCVKDIDLAAGLSHMKADELGWSNINYKTSVEAYKEFCYNEFDTFVFPFVRNCALWKLSEEVLCKHGFSDKIYSHNEEELRGLNELIEGNIEVKDWFLEKTTYPVINALNLSRMVTLPSSYDGNIEEAESHLDELSKPLVALFPEGLDYQRMKSLIKGLEIPPTEFGIMKYYGEAFLCIADFQIALDKLP